ncbi:MAG: succinate dehydrogenase assembly factor 2 [Pseudomonadota bacterium]
MGSSERRLVWRCRRGMLELDLLLEGFLQRGYAALNERQQRDFQRLLELPDQELLEYLLGSKQATDGDLAHVIACIRHTAVS